MIHTIDRDKRYGGRSQRINTPDSMRKAEDYIKKEKAVDTETGEIFEKTNCKLWYSSTGIVDEFARQCMTLQKQQGYHFKEGNKRLMVHQIQSFDIRDNKINGGSLTPEMAFKLGVEFVKKAYPNYQVLVVTHYNKKHIHNHILINSVANPIRNQDGTFQKVHKFQDGNNAHRHENEYTITEVKSMDEKLCMEYGLHFSSKCYQNKKETGETKQDLKISKSPILENYKLIIDKAISLCKHFDMKEFKKILAKSFGITVKIDNSRNSITYKSRDEEKIKKVSGVKLGQGYRLEDINEQLRNLKATTNDAEEPTESRGTNTNSTAKIISTGCENRQTGETFKGAECGKQETSPREGPATQTTGKDTGKPRRI